MIFNKGKYYMANIKKKIANEYYVALSFEYKTDTNDCMTTYLSDIVVANSLEDAYSKASEIAHNINKTNDGVAFHVYEVRNLQINDR